MKFTDLKKNSSHDNPSEMVSGYLFADAELRTFAEWLQDYDFTTQAEIEYAVRLFLSVICSDAYINRKHLDEINPQADKIAKRFKKIVYDEEKSSRFCKKMASEVWNEGYADKLRKERTAKMFHVEQSAEEFRKAWDTIKEIYGLSDMDLNKIHFFVEQVKDSGNFPNSLRRMLYIWGREKMTGKTTSASYIVATLNGFYDIDKISEMSSSLAYEMQIRNYAVPRISECNAVLMDECFYADMGKTYADFKKFLTSSNGRARLPYGQEFNWVGFPNYVATSNEPLQKFIKDWGDRRYLSVEFKTKPTKKLSIPEVGELWRTFIINSSRTKSWTEWAQELEPIAEEVGEMEEVANEFEIELQQSEFINFLLNKDKAKNRYSADNKITLKVFVDYFSLSVGSVQAQKRKSEIEKAVINVFGDRYSTTNYWMLDELQKKASELLEKINESETDTITKTIELPF